MISGDYGGRTYRWRASCRLVRVVDLELIGGCNRSGGQLEDSTPDGRVVHELRAPFRDGTTHFVFELLAFIERLAALVPPPRLHQLTYHGVR